MNYLHYDFNLTTNSTVRVELDKQANVLLLDPTNYQNYRNRRGYKYFGGLVKQSPFLISPPHSGLWHVVIDTGGYTGSVRASVSVL